MDAHTVSLADLAAAAGTSTADLAAGLQQSNGAVAEVSGVVARASSPVAFDFSQATPPISGRHVSLAVVSLAARPGVLDSVEPKCLTMVGELPLIGHVLTQLHAGGIQRCIVVLGVRGNLIRKAVSRLRIARSLQLQFVDLGAAYTSGFAVSLIGASPLVAASEEFLLCTPDHIFDAEIVRELCDAAPTPTTDATALVESEPILERISVARIASTISRLGWQ